jgi:ribonucleoside-diphosphate reductase alpha chain
MDILKRDGTKVKFTASKVQTRVEKASKGLKVDPHTVLLGVYSGIADNMRTYEIDELIAKVSAGYTTLHGDYSKLSARILESSIEKTVGDFFAQSEKLYNQNILTEEQFGKISKWKNTINALLELPPIEIDYLGLNAYIKTYLLRDINGNISETPHHSRIRLATFFAENEEDVLENYNTIVDGWSPPTPTLCNTGATEGQLASCQLHYLKGDSLDGIMDSAKDFAISSKNKAGIGVAGYNQRAKGSKSSKGWAAAGVVQNMKIVNEVARFFDQGGKRPGSVAWYMTPWHKEIFSFLQARKVNTHESVAARDMFYAIFADDVFMEAFLNKDKYYLFCPNELKKAGVDLINTFGDEFKNEYFKAVNLFKEGQLDGEEIEAEKLMTEIYVTQIETGMPYIGFKDNINRPNPQKNLGIIKSSNLCHEVVQYTDPQTVAVCVLSSVVMFKFINTDGTINHDKLRRVVHKIVNNLNIAIDKNVYTIPEAERGAKQQRAIAIGSQGVADTFFMLGMEYGSPESLELIKDFQEALHYYTIEGSVLYSKKVGKRLFQEDSIYPIEKGQFHWEHFDVETKMDWESLRKNILKYGVANSMFNAQMPTATSSQVNMATESDEQLTNNIYSRRLNSGEIIVINRYLVKDFEDLGIWSEKLSNELVMNDGSVQNINLYDYIKTPTDEQIFKFEKIRSVYKTIWETSQKKRTDVAVVKQPFNDQAMSMNVFYSDPNISQWSSALVYAWKKGLKTGNYYCRIKKQTANKNLAMIKTVEKPSNSIFECDGCSS